MAFERLLSEADVLISHMVEDGYSASYIDQIESGIDWIRKNGERYDSYESVCLAREAETESASARNRLRTTYGLLKRLSLLDLGSMTGVRPHRSGPPFRRTPADTCRCRGL